MSETRADCTVPQIPSGMRVPVDVFASLAGLNPKTVHANIKRHGLPFRVFCGKHWIDTDELWNALPRGDHEQTGGPTDED
ncbi:MAG: hypothetical protein ACF8TS_21080 [Maioricimonas sp. JB049]